MKKLCLLLLTLLFSNSLCFAEGETISNNPQPTVQNQSSASTDTGKNTATLIIMRVSGAPGITSTIISPFFVNGLLVDALGFYDYTTCKVAPGKIKLSSYNTHHYNEFYIDVLAGETYYINFYMAASGLIVSAPKFELMDKDIAIEKLKKCKKTDYSIQ